MSQAIFDTIVPSTTSGNQLASILNDFKNAVVSGYSGTARPSQLQAGGYWIDTTDDASGIWKFKVYDGVQDIVVFTLNKNTGLASISSADSMFQVIKTSNDSNGPLLRLLKKRIAGLGQTLLGDTVGEVQFYGTRDDGVTTLQARIKSISQNNVVTGQQGAYIAFEISPVNGATISEVMRLIDGKVAIGTTSPDEALHVIGNAKVQPVDGDNADGSKVVFKKKRLATNGQVLSGDTLGSVEFHSTDELGVDYKVASIDVKAVEDHTAGLQGTEISIKTKKLGQSVDTEHVVIGDEVTVKTDLVVEGSMTVKGATYSVESTTLDVKDSNITVNKGGNQATANLNKAGITVESSDAPEAQLGYDSSKASKFVIGEVGSESEVITATHTQTMSNKTLSSPVINSPSISTPSKLDVKQDTEANLTTYAQSVGGTNGQWCFATDSKVMYQIIDGELVPAGAGGGGSSLVWEKSGLISPTTEYVDGLHLEGFGKDDTQELYCFITVPSGYRPGKPIKLSNGAFFLNQITGNVRFRSETTLIKAGATVLGAYPNKHTSTNAQVVAPAVANTLKSLGDLDLTSASGQINGQAVAKGDMLRVRLYRDFASETAPASEDAKILINNFELRLS